jgi:hypothetical protein
MNENRENQGLAQQASDAQRQQAGQQNQQSDARQPQQQQDDRQQAQPGQQNQQAGRREGADGKDENGLNTDAASGGNGDLRPEQTDDAGDQR